MPRSVNSVASRRRRKKMLKMSKGYWGARNNILTVAKHTIDRALNYAFRDRRTKKRNFRALWIQRINAAVREQGVSYSQFIGEYNKRGFKMNRKVLADLAMNHPDAFKAIVQSVIV